MRYFVLSFILFGLSACGSSDPAAEIVEVEPTSVSVEKPLIAQPADKTGAAVVFASDFAGSLSVAEMAPLVIQIAPQYPSGQLQVDIQAQEGLIVVGETQFSEPFAQGYQFTQEILVGADQAGEYYLGVVANVITASGAEHARAFSETILIVDPSADLVDKAIEVLESTETVTESYLQAVEEISIDSSAN